MNFFNAFKIAILVFLLLFILLILIIAKIKESKQFKSNFSSFIKHTAVLSKKLELPDSMKDINEWKTIEFNREEIPYLFIKASPLQFIDNNSNSNSNSNNNNNNNNTTILICHGAGCSIEDCYIEFRHISEQHNINLICLEYPGFGKRKPISKSLGMENGLLNLYPREVVHLVENCLKIEWKNIILVGQCLGAVATFAILKQYPHISRGLKHLVITKPLSSFRHSANDMFGSLVCDLIVPDIFNADKYLDSIYCDVTCIQGDNDVTCTLERTRDMLDKMINAKSINFIIVPDVDHGMRMLVALTLALRKSFK